MILNLIFCSAYCHTVILLQIVMMRSWDSFSEKSCLSPSQAEIIALLNKTHYNCHRNYMNGPDISTNTHVQINRLNFASCGMHAMNYFVSLGIFMHQGHRTRR